jgi:ribosomal-protein-alanine N-acetyltransferase
MLPGSGGSSPETVAARRSLAAVARELKGVGAARSVPSLTRGADRSTRPTWKEATMSQVARETIPVHVRWMIRRDMPEVLAIEQQGFEFPWVEEDFVRCLRQRNCIGMVAEHEDRVLGFMIYELHKARLHVLNFAVAADWRRRGVGAQMVAKLVGKLSPQRRNRITLEVRETNLAAQLFFRSQGFRAVCVLRGFYEDTPEDAYVMQYRMRTAPAAFAAPPVNRITRMAG